METIAYTENREGDDAVVPMVAFATYKGAANRARSLNRGQSNAEMVASEGWYAEAREDYTGEGVETRSRWIVVAITPRWYAVQA